MLKRRHGWPFSFTLYPSVSVSLCERSLNERGRRFVRPTGLFLLGEFLSAVLLLLWPCVPACPREEPAWLRGHTHTHIQTHWVGGLRGKEDGGWGLKVGQNKLDKDRGNVTEGVREWKRWRGWRGKKKREGERTGPSLGLDIVNALLGNVNPWRQRKRWCGGRGCAQYAERQWSKKLQQRKYCKPFQCTNVHKVLRYVVL